jgi:hypothetical protein
MTSTRVIWQTCWVFVVVGWYSLATVSAQQIQLTSPFHSINEGFYENFGIGLSPIERTGRRGGWFFSGTPANSTPPQFGGYDPAADARFGFRMGPFGLNAVAGQGSNRTHVMEAPTIVIPSGGSGSIFSGSIRPFVTGITPIVGNAPMGPMVPMATPVMTSPLSERLERMGVSEEQLAARAAEYAARRERDRLTEVRAAPAAPARDDAPLVIQGGRMAGSGSEGSAASGASAGSTANHGDLSLREIRQQQAERDAGRQYEALVLIEKGRGKEADGQPGLAKIYYQQALSRAEGTLREQIEAKIRAMDE